MKKLLLIIFALIFTIVLFAQKQHKTVENGILDLRGVDLTSEAVKTTGYWEFYWGKFIDPQTLVPGKPLDSVEYVYVPAFNPKTPEGKTFPRMGYATYRITVLLDTSCQILRIRTPVSLTSQKIFVNGKFVTQIGDPTLPPGQYKGYVGTKLFQAIPQKTDKGYSYVDIVIYVADYKTVSFGLKQPMILSSSVYLGFWLLKHSIIYAVILSIMLYIALMNFISCLFRRDTYMNLTFGILIIAIAIRSFMENQVYTPVMNYEFYTKFAFGIPSLYPGLLMTFLYFAYPGLFKKREIIIIDAFAVGLFLLTLVTKTQIYTNLMFVIPVYVLVLITFITIKLTHKFLTGEINLLLPTIGMVLLFATNVNDSLFAMRIINSTYMTYLGMFGYVILQQLAKTIDYDNLMKENLNLTKQLEYHNKYLASLVEQRTKLIEQQKNELLEKNEELSRQNEEIRLQKEEIEKQKIKIDKQNRHLKSSIEYASSIQKAILPTQQEISRYFDNFIVFMPKEIVSGDFYFFLPMHLNQNNCYFAAVVDCTGHGIPGAFMSLISYMILGKIIITQQTVVPEEILRKANDEVISTLHQKSNRNIDGFDIALVKIIPQTSETYKIIFAGAKLPIFYRDVKDKKVHRIRGSAKSIGGYLTEKDRELENVEQVEVTLTKGSMIWLVSDGIIDQVNSEHQRFGSLRFIQLLEKIADLDLEVQKRIITENFLDWKDGELQRDDVTVLGIRL